MITIDELKAIAQARLLDAEALMQAKRYDGAMYIASYAIELSLKVRICKKRNWQNGFPCSDNEFKNYNAFDVKKHNLDVLLQLSDKETEIKQNHWADWSLASKWNPENRYKTNASVSKQDAEETLESIKKLWNIIL